VAWEGVIVDVNSTPVLPDIDSIAMILHNKSVMLGVQNTSHKPERKKKWCLG